jgi:hypothetical protein
MKFAIGISDFLILSLGVVGGCKAALAVVYAKKADLKMQAASIKAGINKWKYSFASFLASLGENSLLQIQPRLNKYVSSLEKGAAALLTKSNILKRAFSYLLVKISILMRAFNYLLAKSSILARAFSYLFKKSIILARAFSYLLVIRISTLFILIFVALLFACAFLTIAGKGKLAEQAAIWAYAALIIGIILKSVKMLLRERR